MIREGIFLTISYLCWSSDFTHFSSLTLHIAHHREREEHQDRLHQVCAVINTCHAFGKHTEQRPSNRSERERQRPKTRPTELTVTVRLNASLFAGCVIHMVENRVVDSLVFCGCLTPDADADASRGCGKLGGERAV